MTRVFPRHTPYTPDPFFWRSFFCRSVTYVPSDCPESLKVETDDEGRYKDIICRVWQQVNFNHKCCWHICRCVGDVYEGGGGICRWRHSGVGVGVA